MLMVKKVDRNKKIIKMVDSAKKPSFRDVAIHFGLKSASTVHEIYYRDKYNIQRNLPKSKKKKLMTSVRNGVCLGKMYGFPVYMTKNKPRTKDKKCV